MFFLIRLRSLSKLELRSCLHMDKFFKQRLILPNLSHLSWLSNEVVVDHGKCIDNMAVG